MSKTKVEYRPTGDRILVRKLGPESNPNSKLVIPDNSKQEVERGEVIALGRGTRMKSGVIVPFEVKVGDVVLFGQYAGLRPRIDGKESIFLLEDEIVAVVI